MRRSNLRKVAILPLVLLLSGKTLLASDANTASPLVFSEVINRPVTISYYQPVFDLENSVLELDHGRILDRGKEWHPFYERDVWVYLLQDASELSHMPEPLMQAIGVDENPPKSEFTKYEVTMGSGEKKLLLVLLLGSDPIRDLDQYRCQIAQSIYWAITQSSQSDATDFLKACVQK